MRSHKYRFWAVLLLVLALLTAAAGTVYAYLSNRSTPVQDSMTPATEFTPGITIAPNPDDVVHGLRVDIGEPGYPVYVRVAIVVTWEKGGSIYVQPPMPDADYSLDWNDAAWFRGDDGFYYHKAMVQSGADSEILIEHLTQLDTATVPAGYQLHVEVIAQTVQALGYTDADGTVHAVTDAWGIPVLEDGTLKKP